MKSKLMRTLPGALVTIVLGLALSPQAQARETAKFDVLSITGTETSTRDVAYAPSIYGSCAWSKIERIRFHSTQRVTAYAYTSRAHGRARVAWSSKPTFTSNFTQVEVPGEVTVSRSATYQQTDYFDPDTGETLPGCYYEPSPVDCTVERTLPAKLTITAKSSGKDGLPGGLGKKLDLGVVLPPDATPTGATLTFGFASQSNRTAHRARTSTGGRQNHPGRLSGAEWHVERT